MAAGNHILIKGDISGIQDFIFNVQSKGAAKSLKARSFFVEAIGRLAEVKIREGFPGLETIYNSGGNFYLKINSDNWNENLFESIQKEILEDVFGFNISVCLTAVEYRNTDNYGSLLEKINHKASKDKLSFIKRFNDPFKSFIPYIDEGKYKSEDEDSNRMQAFFKDIANIITSHQYFEILPSKKDKRGDSLGEDVNLFGYNINPTKQLKANNSFERPLIAAIAEFEKLADLAKERTGTDKIGILKLDVDNLGSVFQLIPSETDNKKLSLYLNKFFKTELEKLLNKKFLAESRKLKDNSYIKTFENFSVKITYGDRPPKEIVEKINNVYEIESKDFVYKENLYVLFSGGDDCFIIGAWDALLEFTNLVQREFSNYEEKIIRSELNFLKGPITLSAAVLIVDPHFPVVKFAELAESELEKAKKTRINTSLVDASGRLVKNKLCIMGKVFTWEEFHELIEVKNKMFKMVIRYGEAKAFLQRIVDSFENQDTYFWQKLEKTKPFDPAILWRFLYDFRDVKNKNYFRLKFYQDFFGDRNNEELGGFYKKYLWDLFSEGKQLSQILPVAARWTDFLTRNK